MQITPGLSTPRGRGASCIAVFYGTVKVRRCNRLQLRLHFRSDSNFSEIQLTGTFTGADKRAIIFYESSQLSSLHINEEIYSRCRSKCTIT